MRIHFNIKQEVTKLKPQKVTRTSRKVGVHKVTTLVL